MATANMETPDLHRGLPTKRGRKMASIEYKTAAIETAADALTEAGAVYMGSVPVWGEMTP